MARRIVELLAATALMLLVPGRALCQNYAFGPSVRVNDDSPGVNWHQTYSPGQHLIACRGDTVYLVWRDDRDPNCASVFFARSNNGGQSFLDNIRLNGPQYSGGLPSLAVDDNGGIHVCWLNCESVPGYYVYYSKSTDGGQSFTTPIRACDSVAPSQLAYPSIAVSRNGRYVYVARSEGSYNGSHPYWIMLSRSTDGGATFSTLDTRVNVDTACNQYDPSVAVYGDTTVLVAWVSTSPAWYVYFARSTNGGALFGPSLLLNDTVSSHHARAWPSLAVAADGKVYGAWSGFGVGLGMAISDDTGASFSPEFAVPRTDNGSYPSLWASGIGRLYLSWVFGTSQTDIAFCYSSDGGTTFMPRVYPSDLPGDDDMPTVTANEQGRVFIGWSDGLLGSQYDIYCASGALSAIQEPEQQRSPSLLCDVFPNPTCGPLKIAYSLRSTVHVKVDVMDPTGRRVALLANGFQSSGSHVVRWPVLDLEGRRVSSGIYFVRLKTPDGSVSRKVQVIRE